MTLCRTQDVLFLLLAVIVTCHGQNDPCNQYETCNDCIAGFDCVWCPDTPPFSGSRCTSSVLNIGYCSLPLEDPVPDPPFITRADNLGDNVQVSPQSITLNLRTGKPQTFTLSVKPARNYPLDLYFLMDLSGSQSTDLLTIRSLSNSITNELQDISSQFALGFGSFVDKIAYPFSSTLQNGNDYRENHLANMRIQCASQRASCEPTYIYRHHLQLSNNETQFTDVLNGVTIRGNLDDPEATLEALLQTVVCRNIVGWRDDSLKIIMVLTDAGFKTALDGKVAGILIPNDGECHLETGEENGSSFYGYFRDPEQDFPSIYQVRQKLIENDIITIFAVSENAAEDRVMVTDLYGLLADEFGSSRSFVQLIRTDSGDIVDVIRQAYESVTQDVIVDDISGLSITLTPGPNCNLTSDGKGCAGVTVEELVEFNVTVVMETCLPESKIESLALPGFGAVELKLVPLCECNCTSHKVSEHPACNEMGDLVCGICNCTDEFYGDQCECDTPLEPCPDDCFNRGECNNCTKECISCDTNEVEIDGVVQILGSFGARCQCDNFTISDACPSGLGSICSGRGDCECSKGEERCGCMCDCSTAPMSDQPYFGANCGCDPDNCFNPMYPGRVCAHSQDSSNDGECVCGECGCGGCMCPTNSVPYNNTCLHNDDVCSMYKACASNNAMDGCTPSSLDDITSDGIAVSCEFENGEQCKVDYQVLLEDDTASVFVGEERDCPSSDIGQLAWIIAVSIVGGILLLGVILLVVAKIILMAIDKREYKKFLDDMHTGDFVPHNNPLYVTPETEYKNPTLKKRLPGDENSDDD